MLSGCYGGFAQAQMKAQTMKAQGGTSSLPTVAPAQAGPAPILPPGQTPFPKFNPVPNIGAQQTPQQAQTIMNNFAATPQLQTMPNSNDYDFMKMFPGLSGPGGMQNAIPYPNGGSRSSDGSFIYPRSSSNDGNVGYSDRPGVRGRANRCNPLVNRGYEQDFSRISISQEEINKLAGAHCGLNEQPTDPVVCMACNLQFEVDHGDSYDGYVAVSRSVMTRAMSQGYPQSVCGVIYQHNGVTAQYSWTFEDPAQHAGHRLPMNLDSERMRNIIRATLEAFEKGPNGYTNYFANYINPGWAQGGSCLGTLCSIGSGQTFCAIGAKQNRSFDSYLKAEGNNLVASISPVSTSAGAVPGGASK